MTTNSQIATLNLPCWKISVIFIFLSSASSLYESGAGWFGRFDLFLVKNGTLSLLKTHLNVILNYILIQFQFISLSAV